MEEVDEGYLVIRMGVSVRMFLLVLACPGNNNNIIIAMTMFVVLLS